MTSSDTANALLRRLCFVDAGGAARETSGAFVFERDFDSTWTWPDLPFDSGAASSHYPERSRGEIHGIVNDAGRVIGTRVPNALRFINAELERVLFRRSEAVDGASSSSNRSHIGACVWTNLERPVDRTYVGIEGLLHEAVHQLLYKMERDQGPFCDLDDSILFRSPWSGNRIPLHSLVHACLVWFALLTLWCQLARTSSNGDERRLLGERVARILFGFTFVGDLLDERSLRTQRVEPFIRDLIR